MGSFLNASIEFKTEIQYSGVTKFQNWRRVGAVRLSFILGGSVAPVVSYTYFNSLINIIFHCFFF